MIIFIYDRRVVFYEEKNQAEGSSEKLYVLAADAYYFAGMHERADVFCK